jgi:hypothetical protein
VKALRFKTEAGMKTSIGSTTGNEFAKDPALNRNEARHICQARRGFEFINEVMPTSSHHPTLITLQTRGTLGGGCRSLDSVNDKIDPLWVQLKIGVFSTLRLQRKGFQPMFARMMNAFTTFVHFSYYFTEMRLLKCV